MGGPHLKGLAPKSQLLNVTAGAAAILNHGTAFGIRIASFDFHRPNAGNACDEKRLLPFPSGSVVDMAVNYTSISGLTGASPSAFDGKAFRRSGIQK
jgi:hypothetical protein